MTIRYQPTPIDPEEICCLCGGVGRVTVSEDDHEHQVCHFCLHAIGTVGVHTAYQMKAIRDFYGYREALSQGDQEIMRAIAESGGERDDTHEPFKWSVTALGD